MRCEDFLLRIDAYIDGELSNDEINDMRAHAENCESCRMEMEKAEILRDTLNNMDDDIAVPLEAQAAWRRAVRAEAKKKNARKWTRGIYVVAAALVVVLGCTLMFNGDIFDDKRVDNLTAAPQLGAVDMSNDVVMIAADGVKVVKSSPAQRYSAIKKYAVSDMEAADKLISDLAAEYSASSVEKKEHNGEICYCVALPFDYQQDFLNSLNMLGTELNSEMFDAALENAFVRIDLVIE